MNGTFDKKKILREIKENHIKTRELIKDAVKDAKKILSERNLLGYESSSIAVVTLAELIFKIELQTIQAEAKIEQVALQMKGKEEAMKTHKKFEKSDERPKTPVA